MRALIQFLLNQSFFIIFILLETISLSLVLSFNDFQRSAFFSSSNKMVGNLYSFSNSTTEYFGLKEKNELLAFENAELLERLTHLEEKIENQQASSDTNKIRFGESEKKYHFLVAKVINNNTNKSQNYITLNKGSKDGIKPDMGIVSEKGIVGVTTVVSDHFSVAISLLNPKIKISSKFKKNNFSGSLVWDGIDYRYAKLEDISEHVHIKKGDTIVTTGFSSIFPENIPVGIVYKYKKKQEDSYYDIDVKLFTDFKTLTHVKVIDYYQKEERKLLEETIQK